jgi:dihydrofolate synthase/folylpolyglutamate synthase
MSSQDRSNAPAFTTLQQAYAWLDSHINYEKKLDRISAADEAFKLDPIRRLLEAVGSPHRGLPTAHIAGTRGKGSSALALEALARAAGLRVGTFTSPHLYEYRERIRIDGAPVSPDDFIPLMRSLAGGHAQLHTDAGFQTVFELLTAAFFLAARQANVDLAIIETGLGGRLDSTNVIDAGPVLLTRIGLEHMHILGETPEAIAAEKAAILKPGGWGVYSAQGYASVVDVFQRRAQSVAAPLLEAASLVPCIKEHYTPEGMELTFRYCEAALPLRLPLFGPFLAENLQGVLAFYDRLAAEGVVPQLDPASIQTAWESLRLPGRMQRFDPADPREIQLFVDGAHCPTGAAAVAAAMGRHFGSDPASALVGMMADKQHRAFFEALAAWPHWRSVVCYDLPGNPRAASGADLAAVARGFFPEVQVCPDVAGALEWIWDRAERRDRIVALGSIFSVGPVSDWSRSHGRT